MLHGYYRQRLRTLVGSSAAPYGYTLATWTSGAVLTSAQGIPNVLDVLLFMLGAVLGFAFVGALAFGGITKHLDQDHGAAPLIWGSFHFFSVGLETKREISVGELSEPRNAVLAWSQP